MKHSHRSHGFTLVETLMASALVIVVIAGVSALFTYFYQNYQFSFSEQQSIHDAQTTLTTMVREIRKARQGADGSWPLAEAFDNSLTFFSDIGGNGTVERVRYFLSGTDLMKGVTEPTGSPPGYLLATEQVSTVISDVQNGSTPVFTYYNGDWPADTVNNPLPAGNRLLAASYIKVYLRTGPEASGAGNFELSTGVQLRNLKQNL